VYSPKPEGRQRPIGLPTLDATSVQRATVEVRHAIDVGDVRGGSAGCRPGRRPHEALDAGTVGLETRHGHWGLKADLRGFCDASDHAWRVQGIAPRMGDQRVVRPRQPWRHAGGLEAGHWPAPADGTPQGGRVGPVAATSSRHDVLDRWAERWRRQHARGDVSSGRDAADVRVGVEPRDAAERFWSARRERMGQCKRQRHPEKTRLLDCGRCAAERRQRRAQGQPATFDVLGLTPICRHTRHGKCTVRRQTMAQRRRKTRQAVKDTRRRRMHWPLPQQGAWLQSVLLGHDRYAAGPRHGTRLTVFRDTSMRSWCQTRRRRRQRHRRPWPCMYALAAPWLPTPPLLPPSPAPRVCVTPRGRSPVRSCHTPGSVRGVLGHRHPYRDHSTICWGRSKNH
jgi:RNA-directed DNA polymerase